MKKIALVSTVVFCFLSPFSCMADERATLLKTSDDAKKIGKAVFEIVYGESQARKQEPYTAELDGDFWVVKGTLHAYKGGVAELKVNRFDGAVLVLRHGK